MPKKKQSLAEKLSLTTGAQLILVAGSLGVFSFSLGRQGAIQQREASEPEFLSFKCLNN